MRTLATVLFVLCAGSFLYGIISLVTSGGKKENREWSWIFLGAALLLLIGGFAAKDAAGNRKAELDDAQQQARVERFLESLPENSDLKYEVPDSPRTIRKSGDGYEAINVRVPFKRARNPDPRDFCLYVAHVRFRDGEPELGNMLRLNDRFQPQRCLTRPRQP